MLVEAGEHMTRPDSSARKRARALQDDDAAADDAQDDAPTCEAVSYTHLTLPTTPYV